MKLLLENWRKYLVESEQESYCGDLYLFEGDTVTKTSFYNALNTLSESDNDVDTFLENWERSVDYQLENLNEQEFDPILKVSTQAWMLQNKLKEKAVGKVLAVSKKINDFAEKNPKTAKVAKVVVGGLFAAAAVYGISQILQSGGDASDVMELAQSIQPEDPSLAQDLAECAQEFNPQKVAEFAQEQQDVVEKVADTLSTAGEPALDQVGQAADSVAEDVPDGLDFWEDAFEEAAAERSSGEGGDVPEPSGNEVDVATGGEPRSFGNNWWSPPADMGPESAEVFEKYGPYGPEIYDAPMDFDKKMDLLELFEEDWQEFKKIAETLEGGGTLEDLDMTRKDFRKWAADSVYAPNRPDTFARNYGRVVKTATRAILDLPDANVQRAGVGGIPPEYMKALRKLVRASLK